MTPTPPARRRWLWSQYLWHRRQAEFFLRRWREESKADEHISAPLFKRKESR